MRRFVIYRSIQLDLNGADQRTNNYERSYMLSSVRVTQFVPGDPRDPTLHPKPHHADDARILTVSETGFSMLNIYTTLEERPYAKNVPQEELEAFAAGINSTGKAGYLPEQRIAAVPRKFFRDLATSTKPAELEEFKDGMRRFFLEHATEFSTKNLFVDFRVGTPQVPQRYIDATIEVLNSLPEYAAVRRVMFFTESPI
jgi:hypothetical protein